VTDTEDDIREFARVTPVEAAPGMARFMTAMRRLQDIAVSTNPDERLWNDAAELSKASAHDWRSTRRQRALHLPDARGTYPETAIP